MTTSQDDELGIALSKNAIRYSFEKKKAELEKMLANVRLRTIEECAKVADGFVNKENVWWNAAAKEIVHRIRALAAPKEPT